MNYKKLFVITTLFVLSLLIASCGGKAKADPAAGAPPPAKVEREPDSNLVKVEHPEQFPLATAGEHDAAPELNVTGQITPDVSRNVPVVSLASGRVVEVRTRLGDSVTKGQLLMRVRSTDVSGAFSDYRKAVADEQLAKSQLDRAKTLFDKGAIAKKDVEVAQTAEDTAEVDVQTGEEHLKVLGSDPNHPDSTVDIFAPVSGVITDQQVTVSSGVQALTAPNPFTISDLSHVWVLCDVYENDLSQVHLGEFADIHLDAYPNRVLKGRIDNILPVLDPNLRTAKVRLQVENPGILRIGMFVTATFHGLNKQIETVVPASAVLHLHDRDWVYVPDGNAFRRVGVIGGDMLPGDLQELKSGIAPGTKVVSNALVLQSTVEQ